MTFDDGSQTGVSTQAQITESLIRLLAQIVISVGVIGAYLIVTVQGNIPASNNLQVVAMGAIAFWLGQSAISGWTGIQRERIKAGLK